MASIQADGARQAKGWLQIQDAQVQVRSHRRRRRLGQARHASNARCRQAFGDYPDSAPDEALVDGAPDRGELMQMAADAGYVRWLFRPVKGGLWRALDEPDDTLERSNRRYRELKC